MYAVAILRYRTQIELVQAAQAEHREYLSRLKADGTLLASGPMEPRYGGILLLRVPDEGAQEALNRVRDEDPYVIAGVAQYELQRWNVGIGREDLERAFP